MPTQHSTSADTESKNRVYYDRLYGKKSLLLRYLHPLVSFDQQSKSKRSFRLFSALPTAKAGRPLKVLDFGYGHGSFLLKLPKECEAYGCELSEEAMHSLKALAHFTGRKIELFPSDRFLDATEGKRFDVIHCSHVLEHVPDDAGLLSTFAERLSESGRIIINLPINEIWIDPKHVKEYTQASIESLLEGCGLRAERIWICDRWTAFLLHHEQVSPSGKPFRLILRAMRLVFAILPMGLIDRLEFLLPRRFRAQQILVVAARR